MTKRLNRFTTIPVLFDMIMKRRLLLMDPNLWDDKNDSEWMAAYRNRRKVKKLFAICFSCGGETIHHWNAFAGTNGCCIEFDHDRLIAQLDHLKGVRYDYVEYKLIREVNPKSIKTEVIPFTKRLPYQCEEEFRIIWEGDTNEPCYEIPIKFDMIRRITLSQKVPEHVFATIRTHLRNLLRRPQIKINRSTIYENRDWINKVKKKA